MLTDRIKKYDISGRRFGRVTVLSLAYIDEGRQSHWNVRCDCGYEFVALRKNLVGGYTRSCGCLRREKVRENAKKANRKWQIPVIVSDTEGSVSYDSISAASRATGCSFSSIRDRIKSGEPLDGKTFIIDKTKSLRSI